MDVTNITIRYLDTSHGYVPYSVSCHLKSLHVRSAERPPSAGTSEDSTATATGGMTKALHIVGAQIMAGKADAVWRCCSAGRGSWGGPSV
mgnify:CR=1 FL=1